MALDVRPSARLRALWIAAGLAASVAAFFAARRISNSKQNPLSTTLLDHETCPVSTEGGTRRVQLVRERGGGAVGGMSGAARGDAAAHSTTWTFLLDMLG